MRATKILSILLAMKHVRVCGFEMDSDGVTLDVAPTTRVPRCGGCGVARKRVYDHRCGRLWRHLDFAGMKVHLRYDLRRVECARCGVCTEMVPWADVGSGFTWPFEEQVGYLAQRTDKTTIASTMRIAWVTVGKIVARVVARRSPDDRLDGLRNIGIDELSYRRHHKYVTIVTDHDTGRVVWAHEGKSAATLDLFFAELGTERCAALQVVTLDMSQAYIKSVQQSAPDARIVFDRFHVQRLAQDALDEVRRTVAATHTDKDTRRGLKKMRFVMQTNPKNRSSKQRRRLSQLQEINRSIYRACLLKDSLVDVLDRRQYFVARDRLKSWLAWASRSKLTPFVRVARTIRKRFEGVVGYIETGMSNGRSEGINGKARVITRRSYGFHDPKNLIAMLFLCCSIPALQPVHSTPI